MRGRPVFTFDLRLAAALVCVCVNVPTSGDAAAPAPSTTPAFHVPKGAPLSRNEPVTFEADQVSYDNKRNLVTWSGNVEIWQNDHILIADKVTYDRNTGVAAASGHVAIVEPDGEVLFAHYAELTQGMRQVVMSNMRAILANNGKLAANGARRTDGAINEMARAVYTACKICRQHPKQAPFWQIRSYTAIDDLQHKRIEYTGSTLDMFGLPVAYLPYFSVPDPSVRRQSGFLLGDISPHDKNLGTYVTLPYFWAINPQSDATFVPLIASNTGPQLSVEYRNDLNEGRFRITGGVADDTLRPIVNGTTAGQTELGVSEYLFAKADFDWNDTWHYGANVNVASSSDYLRDYRIPGYGNDVLNSTAFIEGFGVGSFSRLDVIGFQGLNTGVINQSLLPFVLPRYQYSFFGEPDALGGRFSLDTNDFNVYRPDGTSDERASLVLNYDRPATGPLGQLWLLTLHLDAETYNAHKLDLAPNYDSVNAATTSQALPTVALKMNWPFLRTLRHGSQILEPIAQVIAAPNSGNSALDRIPNEDSLTEEFTDSTLFALNRHEGIDRLDGGLRANVGLHGNWTFADGQQIDALVGQSYREHIDQNQIPASGYGTHVSDIVGRVSFIPASWLDLTGRGRFDHDTGQVHFADGLISAGPSLLRITGGYIYNYRDIYYYYDSNYRAGPIDPLFYQPVNELTLGASTHFSNYRLSAFARRDLATNQYVALGANAAYENDCFIFDVSFVRSYTTIDGQTGDTSVLFTLTFKTLGSFPVNG